MLQGCNLASSFCSRRESGTYIIQSYMLIPLKGFRSVCNARYVDDIVYRMPGLYIAQVHRARDDVQCLRVTKYAVDCLQ